MQPHEPHVRSGWLARPHVAFVARVFAEPAVTRTQTDSDPRNARAIRRYEKAGFRAAGELLTPDGPALLMYCDRADGR